MGLGHPHGSEWCHRAGRQRFSEREAGATSGTSAPQTLPAVVSPVLGPFFLDPQLAARALALTIFKCPFRVSFSSFYLSTYYVLETVLRSRSIPTTVG